MYGRGVGYPKVKGLPSSAGEARDEEAEEYRAPRARFRRLEPQKARGESGNRGPRNDAVASELLSGANGPRSGRPWWYDAVPLPLL